MSTTTEQTTVTSRLTVVMAVACGLAAANLYYCQPLLETIARSYHVGQGTAALIVTLTQAGYALGIFFVVPLGDLVENRALITRTLLGTGAALLLFAVSPVFGLLLAVAVLIGVTSVIAQVVVPMAAHLAPPGREGSVVGTVMSGLLLGVLLARTVSSGLAELVDWRVIYLLSAVAMVVLAAVLRRELPERRPDHTLTYRRILAGVVDAAVREPRLRRRALAQATMFGAFSAYWTAIAYELIGEHGFSQGGIALFALVGAGGAAAAPLAGRIADRGQGEWVSGLALLLASATFLLSRYGHGSVLWLAVAAVLLDFAVQSHQVMSQHVIYALRPTARARVNAVFIGTFFVAGALSSAASGWLHDRYGWTGVCWFGFVLPLLGFAVWAWGRVADGLREPANA